MHFGSPKSKRVQYDWVSDCYDEDRRGLSLLQREIYLKEEVEARQKLAKTQSLTENQAKELQKWLEELQTFDQRYWQHKRASYKLLVDMPRGPGARRFMASDTREEFLSEVDIVGVAPMEIDAVAGMFLFME